NIPAESRVLPPSSTKAGSPGIVHRIGALEDLLVVCCQNTAFAAVQVLGVLKTKACCIAQRTDRTVLPDRSMRLRGILDNFQPILCRDAPQRAHIRRLSEEMNRHDCPSLASDDGFLNARWVKEQCSRVNVDKCDSKTAIKRRRGAANVRIIRHDDFA